MRPKSFHCPRGFSLVELLVALAISMVLLAALASIFAQSVTVRERIDRDGQKIETARYSLDTLAEDIRLAGYFGSYSPPVAGSAPADWKYVDPCDTTGGSPLPGWNATSSPVQVPFPIFVYEAHDTGTLPGGLTGCLDHYKADTDVLVIRRASTNAIAADGANYVANDPYLQVSTCGEGVVDTQPFHAMTTVSSADFNLHQLGCTATAPGPNAEVRKLITRIYFISTCNDCSGDGDDIPTLKLVELGVVGGVLKIAENPRTVAPGVEDMHIEMGIDGLGSPWATGMLVAANDLLSNGNNYYRATVGGTTGATPPEHTSGTVSDGGVDLAWAGAIDGATDSYIVSNEDPFTGVSGTHVAGMRQDAGGEDRWEDVVALKLFLVTRDLQPTRGHTDAKSFVMGSKTLAAANDAYRRRLSSSTIKVVNMSARREQP